MKKVIMRILLLIVLLVGAFFLWRFFMGWDEGLSHPRSEIHAATLDGKIYVAGGIGLFRVLNSCEYFEPSTNRIAKCADLPRALHHVALAADDDYVYASGGYVSLPFVQDQDAALFRYDPGTDKWEEIAKLPYPIGQHAMVFHDGKLFLIGGQRGTEDLASLWAYDIRADEWIEMAPMPTARHSHAIALAEATLYVTGGRSAALGTEIDRVEVYDLAADSWEKLPAMPTSRAGHGAFVSNGHLHVVGGESLADDGLISSHEILDLETGRWKKGQSLQKPRHGFALAQDPASRTSYLIGGGARPGFHTIYSVTGTAQEVADTR